MTCLGTMVAGGVYTFTYVGGSEPGTQRLVYVKSVTPNRTFICYDFHKEECRNFSRERIIDIEEVEHVNVPTAQFPGKHAAQELADAYADDDFMVYMSDDAIIAIPGEVEPEPLELTYGQHEGDIAFMFRNPTTKAMVALYHKDGYNKLAVYNGTTNISTNHNVTAEEVIEELSDLLNG